MSKGYTEVEVEYKVEEPEEEVKAVKSSKKKKASKLDAGVQKLMEFIFDMKQIEKSVMEVGYDPKKLPLGNLSETQINDGFSILKKIEEELEKKKRNPVQMA